MTRYYKGCSNERYTFTEYEELEYGLLDNKNGKVLGGEEILDLLNELSEENEQLRKENINLKGDVSRLNYIIEELRENNYKKFEIINKLKKELKEKEEEEQLYANEIVKLNKEVKDNQFLKLGNDY